MLSFNGLSALGIWPIDVQVGGRTVRLDPQPASFWILRILEDDLFGLFNALTDSEDLDEDILNGFITYTDCVKAAKDAIGIASGILWWAAIRLVHTANQSLQIQGELLLAGIDTHKVSLGAYVAAIYAILVRNAEDKQRKRIDSQIEATPEGMSAEERYDPDVAADQFEAFMASRNR